MSYIKKIISPSEVKTATERTHDFSYRDHTPGGFAFPCDKNGEPLETDKFHNKSTNSVIEWPSMRKQGSEAPALCKAI